MRLEIIPQPPPALVLELLDQPLSAESAADLRSVVEHPSCWPEVLAECVAASADRCFVARLDGRVAGVMGVSADADGRLSTWMLYAEGFLQTGYATPWVESALDWLRVRVPAGTRVFCESLLRLPKSRVWLERLGFVAVDAEGAPGEPTLFVWRA